MEACLQTARQNYPDLAVKQTIADESLPFVDNSIDIIVSLKLLEHVHDEQIHLQGGTPGAEAVGSVLRYHSAHLYGSGRKL